MRTTVHVRVRAREVHSSPHYGREASSDEDGDGPSGTASMLSDERQARQRVWASPVALAGPRDARAGGGGEDQPVHAGRVELASGHAARSAAAAPPRTATAANVGQCCDRAADRLFRFAPCLVVLFCPIAQARTRSAAELWRPRSVDALTMSFLSTHRAGRRLFSLFCSFSMCFSLCHALRAAGNRSGRPRSPGARASGSVKGLGQHASRGGGHQARAHALAGGFTSFMFCVVVCATGASDGAGFLAHRYACLGVSRACGRGRFGEARTGRGGDVRQRLQEEGRHAELN